jgi:hypothetical protein
MQETERKLRIDLETAVEGANSLQNYWPVHTELA